MHIGTLVQYRVIGLRVDSFIGTTMTVARGADEFEITIGFGTDPLPGMDLANPAVVGEQQDGSVKAPPARLVGRAGSWVNVQVVGRFVSPVADAAWPSDPKGAAKLLEQSHADGVAQIPVLVSAAAGLAAALFPNTAWKRWTERQISSVNGKDWQTNLNSPLQIIAGDTVDAERVRELQALLAAAVKQPADVWGKIGLAGAGYLGIHDDASLVGQQLIASFQAVEVLSGMFGPGEDDPLVIAYNDLISLTKTHRPDLVPTVKRLKGSLVRGSAAERFAWLAKAVAGEAADAIIATFSELAGVRHRSVHQLLRLATPAAGGDSLGAAKALAARMMMATAAYHEPVAEPTEPPATPDPHSPSPGPRSAEGSNGG